MNRLALNFMNGDSTGIVFLVGLIIIAAWIIYKIVSRTQADNSNDSNPKDINTEEIFEEPPLTEIKVKLISKECFLKTYGIKMPQTKQEYYFNFETEDKKILRYKVEESEYHLYDENQKGTIAIVNDNYYGFCVEE